jgi:hypothetical protein
METKDLLGLAWSELQPQVHRLSEDDVLLLLERNDFDSSKLGILIEKFPTNRRLLSFLLAHPLLTDRILEDHLVKASAEHLEWALEYLTALERPPPFLTATSRSAAESELAEAESGRAAAEREQLEAELAAAEAAAAAAFTAPEDQAPNEHGERGLVIYTPSQRQEERGLVPTGRAGAEGAGLIASERFGASSFRRYKISILQRLSTLTVGQKVALALKGSAYERLLLIRDHNRVVATTVLKSPKLNDHDVELYAQLPNVPEEVLRNIGFQREWTRHYSVCWNLVKNPRTPIATSMNLLNRITNTDLRSLQINREVPEQVRRDARKLLVRRHQIKVQQQSQRG